jgi:hypothetical protein
MLQESRGASESRGSAVYIPVVSSTYRVDGTRVAFGARPDVPLDRALLLEAIADINAFLRDQYSAAPSLKPRAVATYDSRAVGLFMTWGAPTKLDELIFFHDAEDAAAADASLPRIRPPYDFRAVDLAIIKEIQSVRKPDSIDELAAAALKRNSLYHFFRAEFAEVLRGRDPRAQGSGPPALMAELKKLPYERLIVRLRELMHDRIEVAPALGLAGVAVPNFVKGCARGDVSRGARDSLGTPSPDVAGLCSGGKLLVGEDRIDDFYSLLAADILNPLKSKTVMQPVTLDSLRFVRNPGETLQVTVG